MITKTARRISRALEGFSSVVGARRKSRRIRRPISFGLAGLIEEHNLLASLRKKLKEMGRPGSTVEQFAAKHDDTDVLDKVLKPLGGYGKGMKLNRSMKKHLMPRIESLWRQRMDELSGQIY